MKHLFDNLVKIGTANPELRDDIASVLKHLKESSRQKEAKQTIPLDATDFARTIYREYGLTDMKFSGTLSGYSLKVTIKGKDPDGMDPTWSVLDEYFPWPDAVREAEKVRGNRIKIVCSWSLGR